MPGPGFEPGLLRPQRSVLTTRRHRGFPFYRRQVEITKLFVKQCILKAKRKALNCFSEFSAPTISSFLIG